MARIRSRGNRDTELALARLLRQAGLSGWRRQRVVKLRDKKRRARRPRPTSVRVDFVFWKPRVAVFVDGCFWHGCSIHSPPARWLAKSTMPATTKSFASLRMTKQPEDARTAQRGRTGKMFWRRKLVANRARDRFVNRQLRRQGWRVVRIWEHELAGGSSRHDEAARRLLRKIRAALAGRAVRLCR